MKQEEFEMFLNFTKLLTSIMKEVVEINKKLTILSCRIPMVDSNPASAEMNKKWQELLKASLIEKPLGTIKLKPKPRKHVEYDSDMDIDYGKTLKRKKKK